LVQAGASGLRAVLQSMQKKGMGGNPADYKLSG